MSECVSHHYLSAYCAYTDADGIIAVFTLMNDALMITGMTDKNDFIEDLRFFIESNIIDFFKIQTSYPAINIGHLGVAQNFQEKGIGSDILDFVAETYANFPQAGCQFITVDSLNNNRTNNFYCKNGFLFQTNKDAASPTRRMFRIL